MIVDKSRDIFVKINDIYFLFLCLSNSVKYNINCDYKNIVYISTLLEIISDKLEILIADYDKFDLELMELK